MPSIFVPDQGLEFPDAMGDFSREINREVARTKAIVRAWDFRPNVLKQLLNYKEDTGSYEETRVQYGAKAEWRNGCSYHDGTDLHYVSLCSAHNLREEGIRRLFGVGVSLVCDELPPNSYGQYQSILGGRTGYISIQINRYGQLKVGEEGTNTAFASTTVIAVGKQYDMLWIADLDKVIDGVNTHWLYINGALEGTSTFVTPSYDWFDYPLMLGQRRGVSDGGRFFKGSLSNLVIFRGDEIFPYAIQHTLNPTDIYKPI